ncbi:LTA synthase family protein [Natroniella sulfidigena]|uniref:LTA synthase family protein n=1 Tax=Natroniella sulfidigena TaxID=723921 RepID=UPI00200B5859|nr:LTA synthase family protein [Natroniella sulfidigena]MCK8817864.1 LTA synthase family protein [Natroniella sulfidigena]
MKQFENLTKKERYFLITFLVGFLIKYNYLVVRIFNVPSITGVILRNLVLVIFSGYLFLPVVKLKKGRISLILLLTVSSLFFLANLWYNRYFGNYLSFTDMTRSEGIGSIKVLFRHIINLWDLAFILDLLFLGFLLSSDKKKEEVKAATLFSKRKEGLRTVIVIVILLLSSQVLITNSLLENESPMELYQRSSAGFVNVYGVLPLYVYEAYDAISFENSYATELETPEFLLEDELDDEALIEEVENIVVIQVESLDEKLINYKHNGREVTPFLNQLKEESLYAENFYTKHVNGSFDADFSFLTSFYPTNSNFVFKANDMTEFDSLARVFKEKDYQTLAFHGNDKTFFNRHQAYPELGFDEFYSREDFSSDDKVMELEEEFYLGINDYDFFKQSLDYLEEADSPFFAYMITVTSHTPFNFYPPDQKIDEYSDIENQLVHDFFQSISFVDKSLEMFFDQLEERGLKEDTLVVIYSDHDAAVDNPEYSSNINFEVDRNIKKPEHIPLLINHPELEAGSIEKKGTITDLAPTLLDLIGVSEKPEGFIGTSLLSEKEAPVLFLHELPQVFYQDHLFVKQFNQFEQVGHLKNKSNEDVRLPQAKKDEALQIINYVRQKMMSTQRLE